MSSKDKVAFIVVGWNNADILPECFESIARQTYANIDTYYVDNDSKDDSVAMVRGRFPSVKIIQPGSNTGFARGNNIGICEAFKDPEVAYIALLNSDARLADDWTERIVTFAATKPRGALYQGTTLDYYDPAIMDSTHIYISRNGQGTQGSWRHYYQSDMGPKKVFGVNAAASVMTRAFLEAQPFTGGVFDERMFMYLEDLDIATRATVLGWDNYLVPGARAFHMGSASSGKNPGWSLYMTFRNNSALLYKNLPARMLFKMLPHVMRADIDTIRALRRTGKKAAARKVLKGRVVGLLRLPLYARKRSAMLKAKAAAGATAVPPDYIWLLMLRGY